MAVTSSASSHRMYDIRSIKKYLIVCYAIGVRHDSVPFCFKQIANLQ